MSTLSPLNFSGLIAAQRDPGAVAPQRGSATPVPRWECDSCGMDYEDEGEAMECCYIFHDTVVCPVCLSGAEDERDAADCCLWKDLDAPTRWRMADAVAAGSTWADELRGYATRRA